MGAPTTTILPTPSPSSSNMSSGRPLPPSNHAGSGLKKLFGRRHSKGSGNIANTSNNNAVTSSSSSSSSPIAANTNTNTNTNLDANEHIVRITSKEAALAAGADSSKSLASSRSARANMNKTTGNNSNNNSIGGRLRGLLPHKKNPSEQVITTTGTSDYEDSNTDRHSPSNPQTPVMSGGGGGSSSKRNHKNKQHHHKQSSSSSSSNNNNNNSPSRDNLFKWQDDMEQKESMEVIRQKQLVKERDGFCRRVDVYDGQVITVDGKATYELGNYLGGGVAGVVYEGHRLRPMEEYPVRLGINDGDDNTVMKKVSSVLVRDRVHSTADKKVTTDDTTTGIIGTSLLCGPVCGGVGDTIGMGMGGCAGSTSTTTRPISEKEQQQQEKMNAANSNASRERDTSRLTIDSADVSSRKTEESNSANNVNVNMNQARDFTGHAVAYTEDMMALEATASGGQIVIVDTVDAPSRSKHYAKAVSMNNVDSDIPDDGSVRYGFMEETVAIKILNPVGFRTLPATVTQDAVVAREGVTLDSDVREGRRPMQEKHVWWLINPNSRNLRTLQRYAPAPNSGSSSRRIEVDRGSAEKGLRISLIAAYLDHRTGKLLELPLTKCIEIWGHVPFGATDDEFTHIMSSIDRINAGLPPPPVPAFARMGGDDDLPPGRVGTGRSGGTSSIESGSFTNGMEDMRISNPVAMSSKRTGIYRAAYSERSTVYCEDLSAYIALPSVPSKYLKWLRQRRAATKEIRNMMLIGRHRNVVHLFEVLEHIQETKSTMFLILELVRGGELFDLISSNAAKITSRDKIPPGFTESETVMRKFFRELASGIHYCHSNSIAHRDLKPENLLVHNSTTGKCTLKIADFGLSAAFGPQSQMQTDQDTVVESLAPRGASSMSIREDSSLTDTPPRSSPIKESVDKFLATGSRTLSFLTCGAVEDIIECGPKPLDEDEGGPSPLKRMTSVVGSPHYVAPEIISQTERSKSIDGSLVGYDGTKADVWSAGVILYAMLYRSLPFGEDLLRCPRYQSFRKWYDEVKRVSGRRSNAMAALNPIITEADERDFLGPHWFFPSETSPESRDLIVCMLNPDPEKRPTIQLVLQHPWILKQAT